MKTAIMTWFHDRNYGTALQVSALSLFLRAHGIDADVVQYIPNRISSRSVPDYSFETVKNRLMRFGSRNSSTSPVKGVHRQNEQNEELFKQFLDKNLVLTDRCFTYSDLYNLNKHYDAFICGSDQIWSPNNFDPHYFLDFVYPEQKRFAYSPSIGLPNIDDQYLRKQYSRLISKFAWVSIREKQGSDLIKELTGLEAPVTCDPTMLLSADQWRNQKNLQFNTGVKPYILVYMLGCNQKYWEFIYKFADDKKLDLKIIPVFETDVERQGVITESVGPAEFLTLVDDAAFVMTDSFHGMIFSLILQTQFIPFERFSSIDPINQNSRVHNLLDRVKLRDRLISFEESSLKPVSKIDFSEVSLIIEAWQEKSSSLLLNKLKENIIEYEERNDKAVHPEQNSCSGCGICSELCPVDAINIQMNDDGFLQAKVHDNSCINCGKCTRYCPFYKENSIFELEKSRLFSYKDSRDEILKNSSSGGASYALSELLLRNGYRVVGSTFNNKQQRAEHICIESIEQLPLLQGSKYLQSDFSNVLSDIQNEKGPLILFGLPCQISAARNLLKNRKDIYFIDLICHGVPSYNLYRKYKKWIAANSEIDPQKMKTNFRSKENGWRIRTVCSNDGKNSISFDQTKDAFFRMFESMNCYNKSCYECPWRKDSAADLRLGDYWGPKFENDSTGVSMIVSYNSHGDQLIEMLKSSGLGECSEQSIEDYLRYQQIHNFPKPLFYDELMLNLRSDTNNLDLLNEKYTYPGERPTLSQFEKLKRVVRMIHFDQFGKDKEKD